MKAIIYERYGSPDVLRLAEVPKPVPRPDEALVKVYASSLNAADLEMLRGDFVIRISAPFKPGVRILGTDVAGRIEALGAQALGAQALGAQALGFQPGDEIWGDLSFPLRCGAFAEYVCIPARALRRKPAGMSFEQAAAVPTAAVVALQKLRATRPVQPGERVLVVGAGGGVGPYAIQLARHFGAEVTGVDSAGKLDLLRSLGAAHAIDYTREDFTRRGERYDRILDVVARHPLAAARQALAPGGIYVPVGGSTGAIFQALLLGPLVSRLGDQKISLGEWQPNHAGRSGVFGRAVRGWKAHHGHRPGIPAGRAAGSHAPPGCRSVARQARYSHSQSCGRCTGCITKSRE